MDSTLLKGLAVLEKVIQSDHPVGVSALASEFQLPKSNMHRTLSTLVEAGFVAKNNLGNYLPTLKTWELGIPIISRHAIRRASLAFMQTLFQEAQETVNLVVLDGDDSLYIHQMSSSAPIRQSSTVGERAPAIMTVSGRVMLAFMPDAQKRLRDLYAQQKSPKPAKKITELQKEADSIRASGYAKSDSIWRPGINSLASVIYGPDDRPVAALAIAGPKERFTENKIATLIPSLLNACTSISQSLGN